MKLKVGDSIINDNGDVWLVQKVHRDGFVDIYNGAGTGEDELTYSAGEIDSFFRKLPEGDYSDVEYLDPKPYWQSKKTKKSVKHVSRKAATHTSIGGLR